MTRELVDLFEADEVSLLSVGQKASQLAAAARLGVDVPDGFIVTAGSPVDRGAIDSRVALLGGDRFAVRTSAIDEDGAESSLAGRYQSHLNVGRFDIPDRIIDCRNHAAALADGSDSKPDPPVAVIVQRMVDVEAAGVAFTADPVTGDRHKLIVSATRGLGDRLMSGAVSGDEWEVVGRKVRPRRQSEGAVDEGQVRRIAGIASELADGLGSPQDVEWAWSDGRVWIVQSRPITALPPDASWEINEPGVFHRSFRFGEWIPEPVTPLFESWLLTSMERRLHAVHEDLIGQIAPQPHHLVVNGWYFYSLNFLPVPGGSAARSFRHIIARAVTNPRRVAVMFPQAVEHGYPLYEADWRDDLLPRYRERILSAEADVEDASPQHLVQIIDALADLAGEYFASIAVVAGSAYKIEARLAQFWNRHLADGVDDSYMVLLAGTDPVETSFPRPLVETIDWYRPALETSPVDPPDRTALAERRRVAEVAARQLLAKSPRKQRRFEALLAHAQHLQAVREEQVSGLTQPWPVMRRAVQRLGVDLADRSVIADPDDVWYLTKPEVTEAISGRSQAAIVVADRKAAREAAKSLIPPTFVGRMPLMTRFTFSSTARAMGARRSDDAIVAGVPASPGQATGPVRIVRDSADFARVEPGDVIVAPLASPALAPLIAKAAALVTDVGSGLAHASIIAREYGVPAIVGCVDATLRLTDGRLVNVNGSTGEVTLASPGQ